MVMVLWFTLFTSLWCCLSMFTFMYAAHFRTLCNDDDGLFQFVPFDSNSHTVSVLWCIQVFMQSNMYHGYIANIYVQFVSLQRKIFELRCGFDTVFVYLKNIVIIKYIWYLISCFVVYCLLFMIHEQEYVLFNYLSMLHRTVLVFLIHGETFFFFFFLFCLCIVFFFFLEDPRIQRSIWRWRTLCNKKNHSLLNKQTKKYIQIYIFIESKINIIWNIKYEAASLTWFSWNFIWWNKH